MLSNGKSQSSSDGLSSLGRVDHDLSTAHIYEQQNDLRLQELNSKVSALHKVWKNTYYFNLFISPNPSLKKSQLTFFSFPQDYFGYQQWSQWSSSSTR